MSFADAPPLRVSVDIDGPVAVVQLAGELDLATADDLRARLDVLLGRGSAIQRLVVDVAALDFVDVTGLAALLDTRRDLVARHGKMSLRRPRPMMRRMLSLLDLEDALPVED